MSKMCEAATVKTKNVGNYQQTLKAHNIEHKRVMMPSKEIILLGQGDGIEVTVKKTKGQKRTSPVANFNSGQKAEKKRSTINDNKSPQNWGNIFREQNLLHMTKEQSTKHGKDRETKKNTNLKTEQKSTVKHPMKSDEKHLKTSPCCSTTLVRDCAVQCTIYNPEIHNSNKLTEFNYDIFHKLHMLALIKQLQDSINKKDKRTCEIFAEMEQTLQKIPDLKSSVVPKEPTKEMKTMYELFMMEREKLQSEILNREEHLKEANKKYSELAKMQKQQLDTATREKYDMTSVITELRQQVENKERIITDLKTDLNNKQTELAQNYVHSKLEIDKLTALSSCKDKLITDYRSTITELQNQIANQLKILNEICMKEGSTSPQMSFIHTGHACSSPTSTDDSSKSLDDISVSSVNSVCEEHARRKDAPVEDPELVSLLDGESSHTVMPDQNEVTNAKGSVMQNNNRNNTVPFQNVDTNNMIGKKFLRHFSKKGCNKENDMYKTRKCPKPKEKQNDNVRKLFLNASKALESITSTKSTVSGIRKQGDMQNRKPVNIPSPLRNCPHPDWSDSSLPSISTVSNLDMMISNDV